MVTKMLLMIAQTEVTRFRVESDEVETTTTEDTRIELHVSTAGETWVMAGPGSARLLLLKENLEREMLTTGWCVQMGTKPVYVEPCPHPDEPHECCGSKCQSPRGGWGGRNYPRIWITDAETRRIVAQALRTPVEGQRYGRGDFPIKGSPNQIWAWLLAGKPSNRACRITSTYDLVGKPDLTRGHLGFAYANERGELGGELRVPIDEFLSEWRLIA